LQAAKNDFFVVPPVPEARSHELDEIDYKIMQNHFAFSRSALEKAGINAQRVEFLRIRGDRMSPTLNDGDIAFIDRSQTQFKNNFIYIIDVKGDLRPYRSIANIDGSTHLLSDNNAYPPEKLMPADVERLHILGRVFSTEKLL